ncbi:hypothetical protein Tsubulata_019108 [Turnera subulata]|uniref:Uncharacterized protein n=1 Tax=Turnera subulata TaxID=218843 RepID=A0A9Q0FJ72_9ROSI|nr:hypothetical protein Tsubulata_019108 [Turnera subulata]
MKVTWKKTDQNKNKKRSLSAISKYPNLPFESEQQDPPDSQNHQSVASPHQPDSRSNSELALSLQSQGDKLAEDGTHFDISLGVVGGLVICDGFFEGKDGIGIETEAILQARPNVGIIILMGCFVLEEMPNVLLRGGEEGKYHEALGKWEAALNIMPESAVLHEQKAQVLLEIGDAWNALKAATRVCHFCSSLSLFLHFKLGATELEPSWTEAWITLGRSQLNFGEPDSAIVSFDRALAIKPDSKEAQADRHTALHLVKRRKQLQSSGLSSSENRYTVGERTQSS